MIGRFAGFAAPVLLVLAAVASVNGQSPNAPPLALAPLIDAFGSFSARELEDVGGGRMSAGTFRPDAAGVARLSLTSSAALSDSRFFGLTLLPRPGDSRSADLLVAPLA